MRSVKWSHRCTPQEEEIATHYEGDFKAVVSDQDGDRSIWSVYTRKTGEVIEIASGDVPEMAATKRYHFDIAKDVAIAALDACKALGESDAQ